MPQAKTQYLYTVDKGVPLPVKAGEFKPGNAKYPWPQMKVNDSFFVENAKNSLITSAISWAKYHKKTWRFVTHSATEKGKKGIRIWRVK